jgi:hypothetical protein
MVWSGNITTTTQKQVAQAYFEDGSVEMACPPLRALLHIMRDGHFENQSLNDPKVRSSLRSRHCTLKRLVSQTPSKPPPKWTESSGTAM